jgi:membrane protein implicated in regulation of membrane protease activity
MPRAGLTSVRAWLWLRGLSVASFTLYGLAQLGAIVTGWVVFVAEQSAHGGQATVFGPDGYIWTLLEQTTQNWQSEFLALAALVALSAVLLHRGSKQSRDGSDEVQQRVQAIRKRVRALAGEGA